VKKLKNHYTALANMGYLPDPEGRVWCGPYKHKLRDKERLKDTKSPCTHICFHPSGGKGVRPFGVTITSSDLKNINRLAYVKTRLVAKRASSKTPSIWHTTETHINKDGRRVTREIPPSSQWPFGGRPCHEFLLAESVRINPEAADLRDHLAEMTAFAITALDSTTFTRLAKSVEVLKRLEEAQVEEETASRRRSIVMTALQALALEFQVPPTKQELRFRADKISAGMKGDPLGAKVPRHGGKKGMDDKQFTRELINPLGLHWLPEADHNRR